MITILVVDDEAAVRSGLRLHLGLESDLTVIGEAQDGHEALTQVSKLDPDIVLMDVQLPGTLNGIKTTRELARLAPRSAVIMLSIYDDPATRTQAQIAGAIAFVEKRQPEKLLSTIRQVASKNLGQV